MNAPRGVAGAIARAGLLTAVVDGLWACALTVAYGSTIERLWQGVAFTLMGQPALDGGTRTALIGIAMHFGVAFGWSTVFVLLVMRIPLVRRVLDSRFGVLKVAAVYGPCIWLVMSLVVIPALVHRPLNFNIRWLIQFVGHAPFVGLPIVFGATAGRRGGAQASPLRVA